MVTISMLAQHKDDYLEAAERGLTGSVSPAQIDEQTLIGALQAGEEWAYEALVSLFGGRLLAVARRMMRNEEDARDVVQVTYLNAFRAIRGFEATSRLSTWLHRIAVNAALMKLRSRSRKPEEPIDRLLPRFDDEGRHVEPCSDWPSPDQLLAKHEIRALVMECVSQLPDGYRQVLILRDLEERSVSDVAKALSITPNAAKIRAHRARQALMTLMRRGRACPQSSTRETRT